MKSLAAIATISVIICQSVFASELKKDVATFNKFRDAIVNNDRGAVKNLLAAGANVNAMTDGNGTPLMFAAGTMRNDIALLLLQNGARINTRDELGRTALFFAASTANNPLIAAILQYNDGIAAINIPDEQFGFTPLHAAITLDDAESVAILLKEGALTNIPDKVEEGTVQQVCAADRRTSCMLVRNHRR